MSRCPYPPPITDNYHPAPTFEGPVPDWFVAGEQHLLIARTYLDTEGNVRAIPAQEVDPRYSFTNQPRNLDSIQWQSPQTPYEKWVGEAHMYQSGNAFWGYGRTANTRDRGVPKMICARVERMENSKHTWAENGYVCDWKQFAYDWVWSSSLLQWSGCTLVNWQGTDYYSRVITKHKRHRNDGTPNEWNAIVSENYSCHVQIQSQPGSTRE